jgi:BirA family biotin operon repressor/biotin-[acetyl-CoA-carboxylase] ligase
MRDRVLKALREAQGPVSGEALGKDLGVSRTMVWKHVKALREQGCPVTSGPLGYSLDREADWLHPMDFPGMEDKIHWFAETPSTMDIARDMAKDGAPHGTLVIAGRQTAGRGRLSRTWHSQEGGLYFTMVLRPALPVAQVHKPVFAASAAMAETLRDAAGVDFRVKWPNDILSGDKKVVGMLSEMHAVGETVEYLNLGVGVNVNNSPGEAGPRAASLKELAGGMFSRRDILRGFLARFHASLEGEDTAEVMSRWRANAGTLGRPVRVETPGRVIEGMALDVDDSGALVVEFPDGTRGLVSHGDCFHR